MLKSSVSSRASADCFTLLHVSNIDILRSCFFFSGLHFYKKYILTSQRRSMYVVFLALGDDHRLKAAISSTASCAC